MALANAYEFRSQKASSALWVKLNKEYSYSRSHMRDRQGTIYEKLLIFHSVFIDLKSGMNTL